MMRMKESEGVTTIIITRHPKTPLNRNGMVQGSRSDVHLDAEGKREAEALKDELLKYKIDIVLSSPMYRCAEGIAPYVEASHVPIEYIPEFRERDYGIFDGKPAKSFNEWKAKNNGPDKFALTLQKVSPLGM